MIWLSPMSAAEGDKSVSMDFGTRSPSRSTVPPLSDVKPAGLWQGVVFAAGVGAANGSTSLGFFSSNLSSS